MRITTKETGTLTIETGTGTITTGIRTLEKGRKKWLLEAPLRGLKKWKFENFDQNSCYIPQKKAKNM